jgi:hypothetical protein
MDFGHLGDVKVVPFVDWSYELRIRLMIAHWKYYPDPYRVKPLYFPHNEHISFYFCERPCSHGTHPVTSERGQMLKFLQTKSSVHEI